MDNDGIVVVDDGQRIEAEQSVERGEATKSEEQKEDSQTEEQKEDSQTADQKNDSADKKGDTDDATSGATVDVDEVAAKVVDALQVRLDVSEGKVLSAIAEKAGTSENIALLSVDDALQYLPASASDEVAAYLTPLLWGIAAGLVVWSIGYIWVAVTKLLGMASVK